MKKRSISLFSAGLLMLLFTACSPSLSNYSAVSDTDLATAKQQIEAINEAWSGMAIRQDAVAIAQFYTKNAVITLDDRPPIVGQANIQADYEKALKAEPLRYHFQTTNVWLNSKKEMVDQGILTVKNRAAKQIEKTKYTSFWRKVGDDWKIYRDLITSLPLDFDLAQAQAAIEASNIDFMAKAKRGDVAALAMRYTEDAAFLVPNMPAVEGRKNIEGLLKGLLSVVSELNLSLVDLEGDADMLVEKGLYNTKDKAGQPLDEGKYIIVWKKVGDEWLIFRDMINTNLPMPVAEAMDK